MKLKFKASVHLKNFVHLAQTKFDSKVKITRSDNGLELKIPNFYASNGIFHQTTCVENPQQNGIVERKHQDLLGVAKFPVQSPKMFLQFCFSSYHSPY